MPNQQDPEKGDQEPEESNLVGEAELRKYFAIDFRSRYTENLEKALILCHCFLGTLLPTLIIHLIWGYLHWINILLSWIILGFYYLIAVVYIEKKNTAALEYDWELGQIVARDKAQNLWEHIVLKYWKSFKCERAVIFHKYQQPIYLRQRVI